MKTIAFLLIIGFFLFVANATENRKAKRSPRYLVTTPNFIGLFQFSQMVYCETGKYALSSYKNYGCWCGRGGSGRTVDATDRCCKAHDECYARLEANGVCWNAAGWYTPYIRSGCSGCSRFNTECGKTLCQCDGVAARCFKEALGTYNRRRFKNYRFKSYRPRGILDFSSIC